ncbi:unnamed protein product [Symbiodinium sp. CCMP2592]|nr:unnamed protein product [Symbiodinium sp. CCMP2592]
MLGPLQPRTQIGGLIFGKEDVQPVQKDLPLVGSNYVFPKPLPWLQATTPGQGFGGDVTMPVTLAEAQLPRDAVHDNAMAARMSACEKRLDGFESQAGYVRKLEDELSALRKVVDERSIVETQRFHQLEGKAQQSHVHETQLQDQLAEFQQFTTQTLSRQLADHVDMEWRLAIKQKDVELSVLVVSTDEPSLEIIFGRALLFVVFHDDDEHIDCSSGCQDESAYLQKAQVQSDLEMLNASLEDLGMHFTAFTPLSYFILPQLRVSDNSDNDPAEDMREKLLTSQADGLGRSVDLGDGFAAQEIDFLKQHLSRLQQGRRSYELRSEHRKAKCVLALEERMGMERKELYVWTLWGGERPPAGGVKQAKEEIQLRLSETQPAWKSGRGDVDALKGALMSTTRKSQAEAVAIDVERVRRVGRLGKKILQRRADESDIPRISLQGHKSIPLRATMLVQRVAAMFDELRDQVVAMVQEHEQQGNQVTELHGQLAAQTQRVEAVEAELQGLRQLLVSETETRTPPSPNNMVDSPSDSPISGSAEEMRPSRRATTKALLKHLYARVGAKAEEMGAVWHPGMDIRSERIMQRKGVVGFLSFGEVFDVIEEWPGRQGTVFLKLARDKGWVFNRSRTGTFCVPVGSEWQDWRSHKPWTATNRDWNGCDREGDQGSRSSSSLKGQNDKWVWDQKDRGWCCEQHQHAGNSQESSFSWKGQGEKWTWDHKDHDGWRH